MKTTLTTASILALAVVAPVAADRASDDLQAIRRAVASPATAQARPPAEAPDPPAAEARPAPKGGEVRWFKVRIVEKGGKKGRVSVNLPLGFVRALDDEWTITGCDKGRRGRMTLGEVLRALDSGQSLVEMEDDDATVRVWVE